MNTKKSMIYYIENESTICTQVIKKSEETLKPLLSFIKDKDYREIVIFTTGSSSNAAHSAKLYMQKVMNIPVTIKEPSLAKNYDLILSSDSLYFAISQGGHSYSTIELVKEIQDRKFDVFTITSDMNSPIAKISNNVLSLGMEIEEMPFVTAGQTATVVYLWLISLAFARSKSLLSEDTYRDNIKKIEDVITKSNTVIEKTNLWYANEKSNLLKANRFVVISYGAGYGVAKEAETKFTETIRVPSHGHELEEYMHGPYIGLNKNDYIFCVSINGKLEDRLLLLKKFLDLHVDNTYIISTGNSGTGRHDLNFGLDIDEYLSPILSTIPFHIISWYISQELGVNLERTLYPDFDEMLKSKVE